MTSDKTTQQGLAKGPIPAQELPSTPTKNIYHRLEDLKHENEPAYIADNRPMGKRYWDELTEEEQLLYMELESRRGVPEKIQNANGWN